MSCHIALTVPLIWTLSSYVTVTCGQICDHERYGSPQEVPFLSAPRLTSVPEHPDNYLSTGLYLVNPLAPETIYPHGDLRIQAFATSHRLYINMQIPGPYHCSAQEFEACPAVAMMFQVGDNATFWDMGGCPPAKECDPAACEGHELDVVQFRIGGTIPGRLYRPQDVVGSNTTQTHAVWDMHATSTFCIRTDTAAPASGDWMASWRHSSLPSQFPHFVEAGDPFGSANEAGMYSFTLHRALLTEGKAREDVQFHAQRVYLFGVAYWYPAGGRPWKPWVHHATCGWLALRVRPQHVESTTLTLPRLAWALSAALPVVSIVTSITLYLFMRTWLHHMKRRERSGLLDEGQAHDRGRVAGLKLGISSTPH